MATILRSSKYLRYFASIGRSLVLNSGRGEIHETIISQKQCLKCELPKFYVTQAVASHTSNDSNLERNLKRLDQNVRRTGRISRRELEDILDELRHSGSATSTQSLYIIRCCGNLIPEESPEIRTHLVEQIWKTLDNMGITAGVPMDISHYNALLRVYLENEHSFSPKEFLANLEHKGLEPNRVTYQRLIARYCQDGDIEGATQILEFMREKQLPVNENVFNALIMGHSQADDMESAVGIVGVMKQAGLEPSSETYTALICGYARKGDVEAINSTLQECANRDIDLLDRDYMNVIFTLAVNNHLQHVDKIIERMRLGAGYNQDAVNLILRLINIGHEDLGFKIFLTMPRPTQGEKEAFVGGFFISQLVKANCPLEKIKSICEKLEKGELNPRALLIAAESSLRYGNTELAYGLLQAMSDRNIPIRQHYFWPLLAKCSKNTDGMLDILSQINNRFKLNVGGETLREYVIPNLEMKSPDEIITLLKNAGVSIAAAASAIVVYHLTRNEIALAAQVATRYHAHYSPSTLRKPLVQAYLLTEDKDSFISILRQIHDSVDRTMPIDDDVLVAVPDHVEIIGQYVVDVAAGQKNRVSRIEAILQGLLDQGLGLSNSAAERLQEKLGEELTDNVSSLLGKLTSGELVPKKLSRPATPPSVKDEAQLLKLQKSLEEKGNSTLAIKKQLLLLYCRNRELEKAEQLLKELEDIDVIFTGGMYAQLLDMYTHLEKLDEVFNIINKLQEREPDFLLDISKIIRVAALLVKNDRVSDAVEFLSEQAREKQLEDRSFQFSTLCFRLLNSLAEKGKLDELKEIFNILVKHEYIDVNNILLGPLIKVHLVRNDLAGALEQFEWCCQNYRATPWKNELARKFIQAEDPTSLQRLTDLSIQIHGEVNSLYDLVFAFVECGRVRQAHKILETPGLRSRPHRLNSACERYQQEGMVEPLERLIEATRDIFHIDRLDIYYHLLLSYCKSGDPDKALGLWTRMQEESVQPSDEFLSILGKFLVEKGRDVPFVVPEVESPPVSEVTKTLHDSSKPLTSSQKLRQALRQNKLDTALQIKQNGEDLSVTDLSMLIESLVKADRNGEASQLVQEILGKDLYPSPRVTRFFLNRLAAIGDIDTLTVIGNHLSNEMKKILSFDNRLCHANVVAGRACDYLKKLSEDIDNADDSQLGEVSEKFPRGGVIGILQNHPELDSEYEKLAIKYATKGLIAPMNVLWMHYFVLGKEDAAEELWNKYLVGSPRIMFQHILQEARDRKDENIPQRLIKILKDSPVSEGARGNSYSCLIDVLVHKEKFDEALAALKEAVDDVCLENLNRNSLLRLKKGLETQGKTFPYQVPAKVAKGSSSSSSTSSDDEPTTKHKQ